MKGRKRKCNLSLLTLSVSTLVSPLSALQSLSLLMNKSLDSQFFGGAHGKSLLR